MITNPTEQVSLTSYIPEVKELLEMDTPKLAMLLLWLASMDANLLQHSMFQTKHVAGPDGLPRDPSEPAKQKKYPQDQGDSVDLALAEAWQWLEHELLIMPAQGQNGANGWKSMTKEGYEKAKHPGREVAAATAVRSTQTHPISSPPVVASK